MGLFSRKLGDDLTKFNEASYNEQTYTVVWKGKNYSVQEFLDGPFKELQEAATDVLQAVGFGMDVTLTERKRLRDALDLKVVK